MVLFGKETNTKDITRERNCICLQSETVLWPRTADRLLPTCPFLLLLHPVGMSAQAGGVVLSYTSVTQVLSNGLCSNLVCRFSRGLVDSKPITCSHCQDSPPNLKCPWTWTETHSSDSSFGFIHAHGVCKAPLSENREQMGPWGLSQGYVRFRSPDSGLVLYILRWLNMLGSNFFYTSKWPLRGR